MPEETEPLTETAAAAAESVEKARRRRRGDAQLIVDGLRDISARFEAFAAEQVNASLEAAIERGDVVTAAECERRVRKARNEAKEEIRKLLQMEG